MTHNILSLIGREKSLFDTDVAQFESQLKIIISNASFLVLGGAGSIGQAVTKELFKRQPKTLHVVDLSENNLVELVRDIRSSQGYIPGDFQTFALDIGSTEFNAFIHNACTYDYVLNLSALKHVRSEQDPFTLMRMIDTNIFNTRNTIQQSIQKGTPHYFCVSTDKSANPVNMMGASKRVMEMMAMQHSSEIEITMARFANVAFSDGSLLHGFNQRILKHQPIVAPNDVKRYFLTPQESGELCLMACLFGRNKDILFPKLNDRLHLVSFEDIAIRYLEELGYTPYLCQSEEEARSLSKSLPEKRQWPCLFTPSDTTGEKDIEEFFTEDEDLDLNRFDQLGVIACRVSWDAPKLTQFESTILQLKKNKKWNKHDILNAFYLLLPNFQHKETGKYLDDKM